MQHQIPLNRHHPQAQNGPRQTPQPNRLHLLARWYAIICLDQDHLLFILTAQVLNWSICNAVLSHAELWAVSARACKECHNHAAMDKIYQYA